MDFVSSFLSLLGLGSEQANRNSDRRSEAFRLAAEVGAEASRTLDIINAAMPRLTRRCAQICGADSEIYENMCKVLEEQRDTALKIIAMAEDRKKEIAGAKGRIDWDNALLALIEWRATASRMVPWVEEIVNRYDTALYEAGAR